jgi:hypothetical protein
MPIGNNALEDWLSGGDWGNLLLAQIPQAAYYSSPIGGQFAQRSPRRGRYYQQAYQDVFSDYLGEIGAALRTGQEPTTFQGFLETDPWTSRYGRLPQTARGMTGVASNPRTRFLYNF